MCKPSFRQRRLSGLRYRWSSPRVEIFYSFFEGALILFYLSQLIQWVDLSGTIYAFNSLVATILCALSLTLRRI